MSKLLPLLGFCLALAACTREGPPPPAPNSPEARGQAIAERICSLCHQVVPGKRSDIEAAAPSFMEIANLQGRNRNYLGRFMAERHNVETLGEPNLPMPTENLSPTERDEVIAFLLRYQTDPARANLPPTKLEPFE